MKYYVTMTDRFMSGWGMAKDKDNKLVIVCDTWDEAQIVYDNACHRSEMKFVNIRTTRPSYPRAYVSWGGKGQNDTYKPWFIPNYFSR